MPNLLHMYPKMTQKIRNERLKLKLLTSKYAWPNFYLFLSRDIFSNQTKLKSENLKATFLKENW